MKENYSKQNNCLAKFRKNELFSDKLSYIYIVCFLTMKKIPSPQRENLPYPQCILFSSVSNALLNLSVRQYTICVEIIERDNFFEEQPSRNVHFLGIL